MRKIRLNVRKYLQRETGDPTPPWRACFSTNGTDGPTGISPVCPDEGHDKDDGSVYTCCPELVIETRSTELANYLVALLNADQDTR